MFTVDRRARGINRGTARKAPYASAPFSPVSNRAWAETRVFRP